MKRVLLLIVLTAACALLAKELPGDRRLVRIFIDQPDQAAYLQEQSFDFASSYFGRYADVIITATEQTQLQHRGFRTLVLHDQASLNRLTRTMDMDMGAYHTYQEICDELAAIAQAYPHITRLHSIGKSIEGRDLWALKISDNPELEQDSEPGILYTGNIHAREIITPEIIMDFMQLLINGYDADEQITHLVNDRQIWLIPMVNPDGHVRVEVGDYFWRKNRRLNTDSSYGVDLNRNFGYKWGYDAAGSSGRTTSETYRGTGPFSEPETRALRNLVETHKFVAALNYHSYGRMWLIPWGYVSLNTPHHEIFMELGRNMTRQNGYLLGNTNMGVIYKTNGDSDDYLYHEEANKGTLFAFTPEVGSQFLPPEDEISSLIAEVRAANFYLAEAAGLLTGNPWRIMLPPTPTLSAEAADDNGRFTLSWNQPQADPNTPIAYDLEELNNYRTGSDDAETTALVWDLQGFTRTGQKFNSGQHAYGAALEESQTATMTTLFSLIPQEGQTLRFQAWYDLEQYMDYFYVRVSQDQGATFSNISGSISSSFNPYGMNQGFGITGKSNGWIEAACDLSTFAGKPILIQFIYKTDALFQGEGVYLDDIGIVTMADAGVLLAPCIVANSLIVQQNHPGAYAYRVRGIDGDAQTSNWSAIAKVDVHFGARGDLVSDGQIEENDFHRFMALIDSTGYPATTGEWYRANYDSLDDEEINIIDLVKLQRHISGDTTIPRPQTGEQILHCSYAEGKPGDHLISRLTMHLTQPVAGMQFAPHFSNDKLILDSIKIVHDPVHWRISRFNGAIWYFSPWHASLDSGVTTVFDLHFHIAHDAMESLAFLKAGDIILCSPAGERITPVKSDSAVIVISRTPTEIDADRQPAGYTFIRNYPNPFNGATVIQFELPAAERVQMEIFTVTGERIRTVQRPLQSSGVQEWKIEGVDWPSGIYFIRISAGNAVAQTKMLLLR